MSRLAGIDEILDLISDVREIDTIAFMPTQEGLVYMRLLCEDEQHSEFFTTHEDFVKLKEILANTIAFRLT
jgi:hypothetical protein